jgi:hypothetical protein
VSHCSLSDRTMTSPSGNIHEESHHTVSNIFHVRTTSSSRKWPSDYTMMRFQASGPVIPSIDYLALHVAMQKARTSQLVDKSLLQLQRPQDEWCVSSKQHIHGVASFCMAMLRHGPNRSTFGDEYVRYSEHQSENHFRTPKKVPPTHS